MKIHLISDREIEKASEDLLGFDKYTDIIAGIARGTKGPFTIAIVGKWGTGKTSLLQLVRKNLDNDANIVTVWFNAWQYQDEEHILFPFLSTINDSLSKKDDGKTFSSLENSIRGIIAGITFNFGLIQFNAASAIKRDEDLTSTAKKIVKEQSKYKQAFETLNVPAKKKVVICIDDLDRCTPQKAVAILESIKLILNQPGFIFILGIAPSILENYYLEKQKKDFHIDDEFIKEYKFLDKIIQLPFILPSHERRITLFIENIYKRNKSLQKIIGFPNLMHLITQNTHYNPRTIKRLLNSLIVANEYINRDISDEHKDVIDISFVFIWELLAHAYSELYELLKIPDLIYFLQECIESNSKDEVHIDDTNYNLKTKKERIVDLLSKDPKLKAIFTSSIGGSWLRDQIKRDAAFYLYSDASQLEQKYYMRTIEESDNPYAHYEYARFLQKYRNLQEAEKYYINALNLTDKVVNKKPFAHMYLKYAFFLRRKKPADNEEAEKYYLKTIDYKPTYAAAYHNYALFLAKVRKDYKNAEAQYKKALDLEPDSLIRQNNYAKSLVDKEDYDGAEKWFLKLYDINFHNATFIGNYSRFLYRTDQYKMAEEEWERAFSFAQEKNQQHIRLKLYFYRYVYSQDSGVRKKMLSKILVLIEKGEHTAGLVIEPDIAYAKKHHHSELATLKKIAKQIDLV